MARPFIACHKFDHDLVFKMTTIIEIFHIKTFESGTNCHLRVWKIFIMTEDTSIEKLPNTISLISVKVTAEKDIFNGNQSYAA